MTLRGYAGDEADKEIPQHAKEHGPETELM